MKDSERWSVLSSVLASVYSVLLSSNKINSKKHNNIHRVTISYDKKQNVTMHQNLTTIYVQICL